MDAITPSQAVNFARSCGSGAFVALKTERFRLVRVLLSIYLVCYLGLSVLCGFDRSLAGWKVAGPLNLGYALVIGNYVMALVLAVIYLRRSNSRHDALATAAIEEHAVLAAARQGAAFAGLVSPGITPQGLSIQGVTP